MRSLTPVIFSLVVASACVGNPPAVCSDCNGTCVYLQSDVANCGACGNACAAGQICSGAACKDVCPAGQTRCNGQCIDTTTDLRHCGGCGQACGAGQACASSSCVASCAAPLTTCNAACVDTQNDRAHCGGCDNTCDAGVCSAGTCRLTCEAPLAECPGALCADLRTDTANCGGCGRSCSPSNTTAGRCFNGTCSYLACLPGFVDCDGEPTNGCESPAASCISLISVGLDGGPANGPSFGALADNSGTRVVFLSSASNLVAGDTNGIVDAFVRDLVSNTTTRISTLVDGGEVKLDAGSAPVFANSFGAQAAISGDGKTLALLTSAVMAPGDTNSGNDVVVLERDGGRSLGMLSNTAGQPTGNTEACCLTMSDDARFITWGTRATGLIGGSTGEFNVYVYDRVNRVIYLGSPNAAQGFVVTGSVGFNAFTSWVSSNGHYILYNSFGDNIVGPADGCSHVYLRDVPIAVNYRLSSDNNQAALSCPVNGGSGAGASITPDGLTAVMATSRMPVGRSLIHLRDMVTKRWSVLSTALDGGAPNADSNGPTQISDDAVMVAFGSNASNLTDDDANDAGLDCYVFDRATQKRLRLNGPVAVPSTDGGSGCSGFRLNSAGTHVVFDTYDALKPADTVNNSQDVYLRRVR